MHGLELITTLVAAFGLALVLGLAALRLGLPALVGYLVAGIALGPATPGIVANQELAQQLAEIGVILLMFGVGLHFSPADLVSVRRVVIPGALVQILVATLAGTGLAIWFGWPLGAALVLGLSLSVASTVVLLRSLEDRRLLATVNGRIAIGWLIVQDLVTVLVLVLLPPLAGALGAGGGDVAPPGATASRFGSRARWASSRCSWCWCCGWDGARCRGCSRWSRRTGQRELFTLCVVAVALGIAFASAQLFGVSFALGAFLRRRGDARVEPELPRDRADPAAAATRSRCCSSSRSACCSTRARCCITRSR
jgi:CPA2 family monovalent cation:H+ antiporter-2